MTLSPTTGEPFYSGEWDRHIKPLIKAVNVSGGKMNTVTIVTVERFQEQADRLIDNQLQSLYQTPLARYRIFNRTSKEFIMTYPGRLQEAARYMTAGLLLKAEFQNVDGNMNEYVQNYIDYAQTIIESLKAMTDRLEGQIWYPDISAFLPPGVMPYTRPEPPAPV